MNAIVAMNPPSAIAGFVSASAASGLNQPGYSGVTVTTGGGGGGGAGLAVGEPTAGSAFTATALALLGRIRALRASAASSPV